MSVTSVKKLFTDDEGADTFDKHRTYSEVYEILSDSPADGVQVIGNAPGMPNLGAAYPTDANAVVVGLQVRRSDDSPLIWYVTVQYDSEPKLPEAVDLEGNRTGPGDLPENPLLAPAVWKLTTQDSEEPAIEGIEVNEAGNLVIANPVAWAPGTEYKRGTYVRNGANVYLCVSPGTSAGAGGPAGLGNGIADNTVAWNFYATFAQTQGDPNFAIRVPVYNSARLPFDPPALAEVSRVVLSVSKNMPFATLQYLLALKNALNAVAWRGCPPRCAKVLKVEHDGGKQQNGIPYVTTQWEIGLDPDTWDLRVLDAGFYERVTYTDLVTLRQVTDWVRIMDANNEPITEPVPLDGAGKRLKPDDPPVFRRFVPRQNRLIDFNAVLPF